MVSAGAGVELRSRWFAAVCAVALIAVAGLAASGAEGAVGTPRIVRPAVNQLVAPTARSVMVAVRVSGSPQAVGGELLRVGGHKAIRVKLQRSKGSVYRGRISRRDLVTGRNHFFVVAHFKRGRQLVRSVSFTLGRRQKSILRLATPGRNAAAPFRVKLVAPGATDLRASLNGHAIGGLFAGQGKRRSAVLAADDGLRFGRNAIRVTAFDRYGGGYRTIQRFFRIGRGRPLVGAGPAASVAAGESIRLDGSASRAGHGRLALRWRIAAAPKGSHARLAGARGKRPRLLDAGPGNYRFALRATQGGASAGRGARASKARPATAVDETSRCVRPDVLPTGVSISTIGSAGHPGVQIGSEFDEFAGAQSNYVQLVVASRCSLKTVSNRSFGADRVSLGELAEAIGSVPSEDFAIVSGGGGRSLNFAEDAAPFAALVGALEGIGAVYQNSDFGPIGQGDYSVIGVPGITPGEGTQLFGGARPGAPAGSIEGLLQLDSTGEHFTFNWPVDRIAFGLGGGSGGTANNSIEVGGHTYDGSSLGGIPGFRMVWLDPVSLSLLGEETFSVTAMPTFAARLQFAEEENALIFVYSTGETSFTPANVPPSERAALAAVAQRLAGFGANPYAFLAQGNGGYAFVGLAGLAELRGPNSGLELVPAIAGTKSPRIEGELGRDEQGDWLPTMDTAVSETPGESGLTQGTITKLLEEPAHEWKPLEPDPELNAQEWIYQTIGMAGKAGSETAEVDKTWGIRATYWDRGFTAAQFNTFRSKLESSMFPACPESEQWADCRKYLPSVRKQLEVEFEEVEQVKEAFGTTNPKRPGGVLHEAALGEAISFDSVGKYVDQFFVSSSTAPHGPSTASIAEGAMTIGSGAVALVPDIGEFASAGTSLFQGFVEIGSSLSNASDGTSLFNPGDFDGDALEWGEHLESTIISGQASFERVADLIVCDESRLAKAAVLTRTPVSEGGFEFGETPGQNGTAEAEALTRGIVRAQQRYMLTTMLPLALRVTPPFHGPFHQPVRPGAAAQGVYEVDVPTGKPGSGTVAFGSQIAALRPAERFDLLEPSEVTTLFGAYEGKSSPEPADPIGLKPLYFLSLRTGLDGGATSAGFEPKSMCGFTIAPDAEIIEVEQTGSPEYPAFNEYSPCSEP